MGQGFVTLPMEFLNTHLAGFDAVRTYVQSFWRTIHFIYDLLSDYYSPSLDIIIFIIFMMRCQLIYE